MSKIRLENVFKVFGPHEEKAVARLRSGLSRDELQRQTGHVAAVIDASLDVREGEIFMVMGLSGSGKSTLVRTINRLHEPTSGRVFIDGEDITELPHRRLREVRSEKIAMVFQHFALFPHRTVLENAAWGLEVKKVPAEERRKRSEEALALVGLEGWGDSYPGQLSGGMQQRVGLARGIATDADILLMDEAFSALDPLIRREMQEQLLELQQNLHKTIVFITHDLNEAMFLGDRIAMMKDGRIVQTGTAEDILQDPANEYVSAFVQDVDRSRVLTAEMVMEEPIATVLAREGVTAASKAMRERQVSALYVLDERKRLMGVALDGEVIAAIRRHEPNLAGILHTEVPAVAPDTPLADLLIPSAEAHLPLPVVSDGRLVGVIPRVALLAALGGGGEIREAQTEAVRERKVV